MFSLMTLNIRFGLADDGKNSWPHREKAILALLEAVPSDFIGFQEVNGFQADFLAEHLRDHRYIGRRKPAPRFWQNNLIFYHKSWKCIYRDHFFLSHTPDIPSRFRDSRWPRQCSAGIFQKGASKWLLLNTHFDFSTAVQARSAETIMHRIERLAPDLPTVLVGDFNSGPDGPCHRVFAGGGEGAPGSEAHFKNVFSPPFPGTHHGFTGSPDGDYIDWVLYRGNITALKSRVIRDPFSGIYPSDHFPIYTEMVLPG